MTLEFVLAGIFTGVISGFFGVGGGMILVPLLMALGVDIKSAISISIVQMVFSSIFGSFLNYKKDNLKINQGIWVGIGGLLGGFLGAGFTDMLPEQYLQYIFFLLVIFATYKVLASKKADQNSKEGSFGAWVLFGIGFFIGIIAMMLGVGGSIILTPILVGFLHFPTKKAATSGLFFVVFSSLSGLLYKLYHDTFNKLDLDVYILLSVSIASVIGVIIGIWLKEKVGDDRHKKYLIVLYFCILLLLTKKIFFG